MIRLPSVLYIIFFLSWGSANIQAAQEDRIFAFGIIADIQYADKNTKGARHYREALPRLKECVEELNQHELAFTIQLGDIIDGNKSKEQTLSDLQRVLDVYSGLSMPGYHVIGNHCLEAGRTNLQDRLSLASLYYDFTIPAAKGWRFIVLDGNDAGYGVMGEVQLEWVESILAEACSMNEKVILFIHFPLLKDAAEKHRMKASQPILKLIAESGCVVACFAGHDHKGGYALKDGVHHVTVKGMVEAPVNNAYSVIEVYPDRLREIGCGNEPSREMMIESIPVE